MRKILIPLLNRIFSYKYDSLRITLIIIGILFLLVGVMALASAYLSVGSFEPPVRDELMKDTGVIYEKYGAGRASSKVLIINKKSHSKYSSPRWKGWRDDIGNTANVLVSRNKVWELAVNGSTKFDYDKAVNSFKGIISLGLKVLVVGVLLLSIYVICYVYWKFNGTPEIMPYPITASNGDKLFDVNNVDDIFNAGILFVGVLSIFYIMKDSVLLYIIGLPAIIVMGITGRLFYKRAKNNIMPLVINNRGIKCHFLKKQIGDDFIPWDNIDKIDSFMVKGQGMVLLYLNDKQKITKVQPGMRFAKAIKINKVFGDVSVPTNCYFGGHGLIYEEIESMYKNNTIERHSNVHDSNTNYKV